MSEHVEFKGQSRAKTSELQLKTYILHVCVCDHGYALRAGFAKFSCILKHKIQV